VDATLGVLTGLSAGITPLGVDILLYCLAVDDEGLIYKMRLRWRRGQQAEGGRGRSGGGRDANATPPDAGSVHLAKDCSCKRGQKGGMPFELNLLHSQGVDGDGIAISKNNRNSYRQLLTFSLGLNPAFCICFALHLISFAANG